MKFNEYDTVRVIRDYKEGIKKGDIGSIVMRYIVPNEAYEVEIVDENGKTKAVITLLPDDIELV